MPPAQAETLGNRQIGLGARALIATEAALGIAALILPGGASANEHSRADAEKAALNAYRDAPTRTIDSFPALSSTVNLHRLSESTTQASTSLGEELGQSDDTLVPGRRGLVSAQASTIDNDTQQCIDQALKMPKIGRAYLDEPGNKEDQSILAEYSFRPLSQDCIGEVIRGMRTKVQMTNPNNPKQWLNALKYKRSMGGGIGRGEAGSGGIFFGAWVHPKNNPKSVFYRCTTGPLKTLVRGVAMLKAKVLSTGKTIQRIAKFPIKVKRTDLDAEDKKNGGLPGPC